MMSLLGSFGRAFLVLAGLGVSAGAPITPAIGDPAAVTTGRSANDNHVRYEAGLIYGRFDDVPLAEVLQQLDTQAAIEFSSSGMPDYPVSGRFEGVPVAEVLEELLVPVNFALVPQEGGKPRKLILMGTVDPEKADRMRQNTQPASEQEGFSADLKTEMPVSEALEFPDGDASAGLPEVESLPLPYFEPVENDGGPPPANLSEDSQPPGTSSRRAFDGPQAPKAQITFPDFQPHQLDQAPGAN